MKKPFVAFALLYLVAAIANAQSLSDVKLGLGLKHITNRYEWNIMVPALEGEYTRKLSKALVYRECWVSVWVKDRVWLAAR